MDLLELQSELFEKIRKFALHNAIQHHGKANVNAVLGKVLAEHPELRSKVKEILEEIKGIVGDINSKSEAAIKSELSSLAPELLHKKKQEKHIELPDLPNVTDLVVMRFAPGPSGPLHIGHTRAIVLNDAYVNRYNGKFIIRFEDTNPQNIEPTAYDLILEDLAWLGVKYHEVVKQSDRFDLYYDWAKKLLKNGNAYICTCPVESWRELKKQSKPCPDRELPSEEQLSRWEAMLVRKYHPGEVSMVIKTDLAHPNPAVRDFVGFRIIDHPHPLTKDKYYIYPTYNFSVAIDDHLMGMTHILRGKDHLNNTHRQRYIYEYLAWPQPEFLHYGWVSMPEVILKTSIIKEGINSGKFEGWSDIQLGTLQALIRRGLQPEALKRYWLDIGIKDVDITFSWETLYALNKDLIDGTTDRYFFVWDPVKLIITDVETLTGHAPLHPDNPARGSRETVLEVKTVAGETPGIPVFVARDDLEGVKPTEKIRLKDLCNLEVTSIDLPSVSYVKYIGNDLEILKKGAKIVHWVSFTDNYPATIYLPDGGKISGVCEKDIKNALNSVVQFERFGFVKLGDSTQPLIGWLAHK